MEDPEEKCDSRLQALITSKDKVIEMSFDPLSFFAWTPLHDMDLAEKKYGEKLGLYTKHSKWGVGQLLYLDRLNWSNIDQLIDFERMNWDSTFAMDFASLASILNTNKVPCRSWEEVKRILNVYRKSWKTRFLISLFCEGLSKEGYLGMPLYYSELVGYRIGAFYGKKGLLDVIEKTPEIGFEVMVLGAIDKMSDPDTRSRLRRMLDSDQRDLVYPFLLYGSNAMASYRKLEKVGGKDAVIGKAVPEEVRDEVYMMLISTTSNLFYFGPKPKLFTYDELFSKIHIKGLTHFGADTSIRSSPHFLAFQAEIGHLVCTPSGDLKEMGDALFRSSRPFGAVESELKFDRVTDSSPPEMPICLEWHTKKMREREKSYWSINPEWLKRLRTEDF